MAERVQVDERLWNSPWDAQMQPIGVHLLEVRVRETGHDAALHREQVATLTRRMEIGTAKIAAARQSGASESTLADAERRLQALRVERDRLHDRYLLPHELLTALLTAARGAVGRPPGSWIGVYVPGVVRCAVSLVDDEPPF
jgi:hypothetical protein